MSGIEAAAIAGTALQVGSSISSGMSRAQAVREQARLADLQARDLLERQDINEQLMREQALELTSQYQNKFASTGREGAGIGGALKIHKDLETQISLARREAETKAYQLRAGAAVDLSLASDYVRSGYFGGLGAGLLGGSQIASNYQMRTKKSSGNLPGYG